MPAAKATKKAIAKQSSRSKKQKQQEESEEEDNNQQVVIDDDDDDDDDSNNNNAQQQQQNFDPKEVNKNQQTKKEINTLCCSCPTKNCERDCPHSPLYKMSWLDSLYSIHDEDAPTDETLEEISEYAATWESLKVLKPEDTEDFDITEEEQIALNNVIANEIAAERQRRLEAQKESKKKKSQPKQAKPAPKKKAKRRRGGGGGGRRRGWFRFGGF